MLNRLKRQIEKDRNAVIIYQPQIYSLFQKLRELMKQKNFYDCYFVCEKLEQCIETLSTQRRVFSFVQVAEELGKELQSYRNSILSDPNNAMLWAKIRHDQEMLAEKIHHDQEMKELAEEQLEEQRKANEIAENSFREQSKQSTLATIDTIANVYTASQTRKIRKKLEND